MWVVCIDMQKIMLKGSTTETCIGDIFLNILSTFMYSTFELVFLLQLEKQM